MKRYFPLLLLSVFVCASSLAQKTANAYIANPNVAPGTYSFDIFVKRTGVNTIRIGTSNFIFDFNRLAFGMPTLTNVNPKYTETNPFPDDYLPMSARIDTIGGTIFKLNIVVTFTGNGPTGTGGLLSTTEPEGEIFCRVNLPIVDPNATAGLSWDVVNSGITHLNSEEVQVAWLGSDNSVLPVQLASFTGSVVNAEGHVRLNWRTLTETNNYGFYVEKSQNNQTGYQTISDVIPGHGTTLEPHDYTWTDVSPQSGTWYYRLKQVDLDGTPHFSEGILPTSTTGVKEKPMPTEFALNQNYPNPFNPSTVIEYALPKQSSVKLEVYNLIGQRVATLVEGVKTAGYHSVQFNASGIASGLYFYRFSADGNVNFLKKMVLMK